MKFLWKLGLSRGFMGGSRIFTTLGVVAGLYRLLQRLSGGGETTAYKHKLKKGEVLVISDGQKSS